jgi:hypothetical protein
MASPELSEAVALIRKSDKMKEWTDTELIIAIRKSIAKTALTYTRDENGKLDGICFGKWYDNGRVLHVTFITGKLRTLFRYLRSTFPQCVEITGYRDGEFVKYKLTNFKL